MMLADILGFWGWFWIMLILIMWGIGSMVKDTVEVTKKVVQSDTAKEVGKGVIAAWLDGVFSKK